MDEFGFYRKNPYPEVMSQFWEVMPEEGERVEVDYSMNGTRTNFFVWRSLDGFVNRYGLELHNIRGWRPYNIMGQDTKCLLSSYLLRKIIDWRNEVQQEEPSTFISTLVYHKLLFFITAMDGDGKKEGEPSLFDIFDNFEALPFGHFEMDLYESENKYKNPDDPSQTGYLDPKGYTPDFKMLGSEYKRMVDEAIGKLRSLDDKIVLKSGYDMVELNRVWYSWQYYYAKTKPGGRSLRIPPSVMKVEEKIYRL